ncbi:SpoIIIAH-like family protein [Brevibacillus fulvus]|uniref:Stage III sporulation protein AH n=1 Tax=Brevibacillus fulvus TaxID=1125967 RepID=A0A938XZX0_9BACL|nr:SpoIIIAH-like family protein [Brevibacillus fulvus]MBM7588580.1 stage III sporulation protein AH [Brevibacillus fulvus]
MMLRKQTVWLLTMLAVMVVLSGYYLVKGPAGQVPAIGEQQTQEDDLSNVQVETKESQQDIPNATPVEGTDNAEQSTAKTDEQKTQEANAASTLPDSVSDLFQGYKMKREAMMQQQKDEQLSIMSSADATPQAVAEAKAKYEELSNLENATLSVEELLKASGYKDAVISVQNNKATVLVQKDKLQPNEVVNIIAQVKQHLNIPATNITVQFKNS